MGIENETSNNKQISTEPACIHVYTTCMHTRRQKRRIEYVDKYYHNIKTYQPWVHPTYTHTTTASPDMPNVTSGMSGHAQNQSFKNFFEFCVKNKCSLFVFHNTSSGSRFLFVFKVFKGFHFFFKLLESKSVYNFSSTL